VQQEGSRLVEQMRQAREIASWLIEATASGHADAEQIHEKAKKIDELLS
jgi:hypothetical protein